MGKSEFVLVHGACHGAWCWYKVATLLQSEGHKVTALDLAACGVDPKQVNEVRTLSAYNQPLFDFMEALPAGERVILVGHSLGGLSVTLAMEAFPHKISVAVFAGASAASLPSPDSSRTKGHAYTWERGRGTTNMMEIRLDRALVSPTWLHKFVDARLLNLGFSPSDHSPLLLNPRVQLQLSIDFMDSEYRYDNGPDKPATSIKLGPKCLATRYYHQSPPEDLLLGQLLVRFCPFVSQQVTVTKENYGSVHRVYVLGDKDLVVKTPTDGSTFIPGADHMLMFSRPLELSSYLLDIASNYI